MKKGTIITLLFLLTIFGCESMRKAKTIVYYNGSERYGGEIWGSSLHLFYKKDKDIKVYKINSQKLNEELTIIKNMIIKKDSVVYIDDSFYAFSFITNESDTLYANNNLSYWRFKNLVSEIGKNNVKEILIGIVGCGDK